MRPTAHIARFYPFTAPEVSPLIKYFWAKGYTTRIGRVLTNRSAACMLREETGGAKSEESYIDRKYGG
jgi:hypothetical protein